MATLNLKIKLFGELSISSEYHHFENGKRQNQQVIRLLSYLLAHPKQKCTKDELLELLWDKEECTNPNGALRNLIYRARKELEPLFPKNFVGNRECLHYSQGSYIWDPSVPCTIDTVLFEEYIAKASRERDARKRLQLCDKAFALYDLEFLPTQSDMYWTHERREFYKKLFVKCVTMMCRIFAELNDYESIISTCESAILIHDDEEAIHCEKLKAYYQLGMISPALDYYYIISNRFPVDRQSEEMKKIFRMITDVMPEKQNNINILEDQLKVGGQSGTFRCDYDSFRSFFQIFTSSIGRKGNAYYLVLISLTDMKNPGVITEDVTTEMNILDEVLTESLRTCDIFTQMSSSQYSLLLNVSDKGGLDIALDRTINKYNDRTQHANITCDVESKLIS